MRARDAAAALALAGLLAPGPARAFTQAQVEQGLALYSRCTECHSLGERKAVVSPLAGPHALPAVVVEADTHERIPLDTVADLADLIMDRMPGKDPGTLTEDESLALTAFLLSMNGLRADGRPLDREAAETTRLDALLPQRRSRLGWYVAGGAALLVAAGALALRRRGREAP